MLYLIYLHVKVALDKAVSGPPIIACPVAGTFLTQVNFRNAVHSDMHLVICVKTA